MNNISEIVNEFKILGGEIWLEDQGRLRVRIPKLNDGRLISIVEQLREHKENVLQWIEAQTPKPFFHPVTGDLVIPFECMARYRWWDDSVFKRMKISEIREEVQRHSLN